MRGWHVLGIGVLVAFLAFRVGYSRGVDDCPARANAEAAHDAAIDRDLATLFSEPTQREQVCDRIFDLVIDEVSDEALLEQEERSQ